MNTEPIGFNTSDLSFIVDALNNYWHDANKKLQSKELGDIEKRNLSYQLSKSKELMSFIQSNGSILISTKKMAIALQDVVSDLFYQIESKHGAKVASEYPCILKAKEALKEAGL